MRPNLSGGKCFGYFLLKKGAFEVRQSPQPGVGAAFAGQVQLRAAVFLPLLPAPGGGVDPNVH